MNDHLESMQNLFGNQQPPAGHTIQTIGADTYANVPPYRQEIAGTIRKELVTQMQSDMERKDLVRAFVYENDYSKTLEQVNENLVADNARLVSFITNVFPSVVVDQGSIEGCFDVFAETPTGTLSWSINEAHRPKFAHLPIVNEYTRSVDNDSVMSGYSELKNAEPVTAEDRLRKLLTR